MVDIFDNLLGQKGVTLDGALQRGVFDGVKGFFDKGADWIISTVKDSGLRGRGGAGFSTGMKWSFMPKREKSQRPHYLVVNADESEPGTCKDREIIRNEPYKMIEGIMYASFAIGANVSYVYIRGEYYNEAQTLIRAVEECYAKGILGKNASGTGWDMDIIVHRGAGAYICGEETAMLESLTGNKGQPRLKPPFPAMAGLYGCPTTINNVESIAVVPDILKRGADWFKSIGRENNTGRKVYCVSGHVNKPCVFEDDMSLPFHEMMEKHCGGIVGGKENLLAIIPGGSSCPLIPEEMCKDLLMDYDDTRRVGSSFGTGGVIVMAKEVNGKKTDIIKCISRITDFYKHESCGQCTPCREGVKWLSQMMKNFVAGKGKPSDIDKISELMKQIEGKTICAFGDAAVWPIQSLIRHYRVLIENRMNG